MDAVDLNNVDAQVDAAEEGKRRRRREKKSSTTDGEERRRKRRSNRPKDEPEDNEEPASRALPPMDPVNEEPDNRGYDAPMAPPEPKSWDPTYDGSDLSPAEVMEIMREPSWPTADTNTVIEALKGVYHNWDAVLDALGPYKLSNTTIENLLRLSARDMGHFTPDPDFMDSARTVLRYRLAGKQPPTGRLVTPEKVDQGGKCVSKLGMLLDDATESQPLVVKGPGAGEIYYPLAQRNLGVKKTNSDYRKLEEEDEEAAKETKVDAKTGKKKATARSTVSTGWGKCQWTAASILFVLAIIQAVLFAVFMCLEVYPDGTSLFGPFFSVAQGSAWGACFWMLMLFLTMSSELLNWFANMRCCRRSRCMVDILNSHKELHIFCAFEMMVFSFIHVLAHYIGIFPKIWAESAARLNAVLACGRNNKDMPVGYLGRWVLGTMEVMENPECRFGPNDDIDGSVAFISTAAITGWILVILFALLGWFSRKAQIRRNYKCFQIAHHVLLILFLAGLIMHGANNWMGLGFPLILLVAWIGIIFYLVSWLRRMFVRCSGGVSVHMAQKSVEGSLLRLQILLPSHYAKCNVGDHMRLNFPQAGKFDWHPYTICSAEKAPGNEQLVSFCIMRVGKWTEKVHDLFDQYIQKDGPEPRVLLEGPHHTPVTSVPANHNLVAIGAGLGVTPFVSFLANLGGNNENQPDRANIYWTHAYGSDFHLMKDLLTTVERRRAAHGDYTTFSLHTIPRMGAWDGRGLGNLYDLCAADVWASWQLQLRSKYPTKVPVFSKYESPPYAVVADNVLHTRSPVAIVFGPPEWHTELLAVGQADLSKDVFVYFNGREEIRRDVVKAVEMVNKTRADRGDKQRYTLKTVLVEHD